MRRTLKFGMNIRNPKTGTSPFQNRADKTVYNDKERTEDSHKHFCSDFAKQQDDVVVSLEDNEVLSSPLVTKEDVKQYTIEINIFT